MAESTARRRQSRQRAAQMLAAALELFCEQGIEETTIEQVALRAGTGTATVYRYFATKAELAVSSATFYWQRVSAKYVSRLERAAYLQADGRGQLQQIMDIFADLFEEEFLFLKFLYEFDAFVMKHHISWEKLAQYEACILDLKVYLTQALQKGLADGSLCLEAPVDEVYFTVTHMMLSLMQKLAAGGRLLRSDQRVALAVQVRLAGRLLVRALSAQPPAAHTQNTGRDLL